MAVLNVNPTRMELTNLKRKLVTAQRGHKLLKDKRDELMRRFLDLVRENKELRRKMIPKYDVKMKTAKEDDIYSYGYAFTSDDLDVAVKSLSDIMPLMIRLAEVEKSCQMMADEIEKTRRRVNALEHVMIPQYQETIKYITMKLDENERSTTTRLMKVKDMMLAQAHGYETI